MSNIQYSTYITGIYCINHETYTMWGTGIQPLQYYNTLQDRASIHICMNTSHTHYYRALVMGPAMYLGNVHISNMFYRQWKCRRHAT